jgi:putative ABC transport system substrate-binding protein
VNPSVVRALLFALLCFLANVAWSQAAPGMPRLGILLFGTPQNDPNLAAFKIELDRLGYADGRNIAIDYRYAEGRPERGGELARQLVASKPDLIMVFGGDMVKSIKEATTSLPVVILTSQDPVEGGVIASFARPGGNVTGVAFVSEETGAKRLQLLKEAIPSLARVAVLWTPDHPDGEIRDIRGAGQRLGIEVQSLEVRRPEDFDGAFKAAVRRRPDALMVVSSRFMTLNGRRILEFAKAERLPVASGWGQWAREGGLLSYGPDLNILARRAAVQVDKILKGAKPADLPVEQPTKFEFIINVRTAKSLGLTIPPALLARADQVINQ